MATYKRRGDSFIITVSHGYDSEKRQLRQYETWTPDCKMTEWQLQKALTAEMVRFEDLVKAGKYRDCNMRFRDFWSMWMSDYCKSHLRSKTCQEYEKLFTRIDVAIGQIKLKELSPRHLNAFYKNLSEEKMNKRSGKTLSPRTIHSYHRAISSALSKAVQWEYIYESPAARADPPKVRPKETPHLDEDGARRVLIALYAEPIKYRAMLTCDLLSGMRRGELVGLPWSCVDFERCRILVKQQIIYLTHQGLHITEPKTDKSIRYIEMPASFFELLKAYQSWQAEQKGAVGDIWANEWDLVFTGDTGKPIHPDALTKWVTGFIKRHDLPRVTVHGFRHTFASMLLAENVPTVDVAGQLGHATPTTTNNIYAHTIAAARSRTVQVVERFDALVEGSAAAPATPSSSEKVTPITAAKKKIHTA